MQPESNVKMIRQANEQDIGRIVVTAGHVRPEWASRHDAPEYLVSGIRFILKDIKGPWGFFYRDDMGVLKFPITATDFYER